ncbi:glycoside hydrolase superfamily, partial [Coniella lustricola]
MAFRNAFVAAAAAAAPAMALVDSVNVYFGQHGSANISDVCADPSFEYITLGFITTSPENGGLSGYPADNFGGHCWVGYYDNNGVPSELLSDCPYLVPGIEICQKQYNKKVLLSIGGETLTGSYSISSYDNGVDFANFLWNSFGPYNPDLPNQPRPFDTEDSHVAVDGFDFDIEWADAGDEGYRGMIETLRTNIDAAGRSDIITAAPQCILDSTNQMWNLLQLVRFDRLFVQFYNNPSCNILNDDGSLNQDWNYPEWETFLAGTPSANASIHVGLPGSDLAAGSGYVDVDVASAIMCILQASDYPMFGGASIWDQTFAADNVDANGKSYNEVLYDAMRCGCDVCPSTSSSSSIASSSSSTAFSSSTQSSSLAVTGRPSSSTSLQLTGPSSHATSSTQSSSSGGQLSHRPTHYSNSTSTSTALLASGSTGSAITSTSSASLGDSITQQFTTSTSTALQASGSTGSAIASTSSASLGDSITQQLTTSTIFSTTVYTITSCAASITDCPAR